MSLKLNLNSNRLLDITIVCFRLRSQTTTSPCPCTLLRSTDLLFMHSQLMYRFGLFLVRTMPSTDRLTERNSVLLCRYAGYVLTDVQAPGTGRIWLDEVQCKGYEIVIDQCPHKPWGSHGCNHDEDVSIYCYERSTTVAPTTTTSTIIMPTTATQTTTTASGTSSGNLQHVS